VRLPVWLLFPKTQAYAAPLRGRALLYLRPGHSAPARLLFPQAKIIAGTAPRVSTAASGAPACPGDKAVSLAEVPAMGHPQKVEARS